MDLNTIFAKEIKPPASMEVPLMGYYALASIHDLRQWNYPDASEAVRMVEDCMREMHVSHFSKSFKTAFLESAKEFLNQKPGKQMKLPEVCTATREICKSCLQSNVPFNYNLDYMLQSTWLG